MRRLIFCLCLFLSPLTASHADTVPRVVVSIAPLHSLVTGVMAGVGTPQLLVDNNASPHGMLLKPSQVIALHQADVIIWTGKSIEAFLPRMLDTLAPDKHIIEVMSLPGIKRLATRSGGLWPEDSDTHEHQHSHGEIDGHLWLDPDNARIIVDRISTELARIDASHAKTYRNNAEKIKQRILTLDQTLTDVLVPARGIPYLVFHDAYQYLERHYKLNPVGAIMVDPEHKPGARRLAEIRARLDRQHVHCVFSEPQFSKKLPDILVSGTRTRSATLDPLGLDLPIGEDLYFDLMLNLARNLASCLTAD